MKLDEDSWEAKAFSQALDKVCDTQMNYMQLLVIFAKPIHMLYGKLLALKPKTGTANTKSSRTYLINLHRA